MKINSSLIPQRPLFWHLYCHLLEWGSPPLARKLVEHHQQLEGKLLLAAEQVIHIRYGLVSSPGEGNPLHLSKWKHFGALVAFIALATVHAERRLPTMQLYLSYVAGQCL